MSPGAWSATTAFSAARSPEGLEQRVPEVLLRPERPGNRPSGVTHARRIGAEENRGGGHFVTRNGHRHRQW